MKIVFAGTPEFAVPALRAIYETYGDGLVAVVTQPDKPQGRKGILTPPPVKEEAIGLGVPVLQFPRIRDCVPELAALHADLMVTCAYGQILTQEVLDLFPMGVWNIHASLLPAYRGAAPIARAIIDGENVTGITIMKTELGLDTGDMLLSKSVEISDTDTADALTGRLALLAAKLIPEALGRIGSGKYSLIKQGEGFTCKKVQRTQVDFSKSAREVSALVRGLSSAPGSWGSVGGLILNFFYALPAEGSGAAGEILSADPKTGLVVACGEGAVRISMLQPAGGKCMADTAFLNGRKLQKGVRFDQPVL